MGPPSKRKAKALVPSGGTPLPAKTRRRFESAMNVDLRNVRTHASRDVGEHGARAVTIGRHVFGPPSLFAPDAKDDVRTLAHELTHTVQQQERSPHGALERTAPRSLEERYARRVADVVSTGRPVDPAWLRYRSPRAFIAYDDEPTDADRAAAADLRLAVQARDQAAGLRVLRGNTGPAMHRVRAAYGEDFVPDLRQLFRYRARHPNGLSDLILRTVLPAGTEPWGEARALLGDALTLEEELRTLEGIMSWNVAAFWRVLEEADDEHVLRMFEAQGVEPEEGDRPTSNLAGVRALIENALGDSERWLANNVNVQRAMRILLAKANRARAARRARGVEAPRTDGDDADDGHFDDPLLEAHVDLVWSRIVEADRRWGPAFEAEPMASRAYLALADLEAIERRAIGVRIRARTWSGFDSDVVARLEEIADERDDAQALSLAMRQALTERHHDAYGMQLATERAGTLVHRARTRDLERPPTPPGVEVPSFLEFGAPPSEGSTRDILHDPVLLELLLDRSGELMNVGGQYIEWMRSMGMTTGEVAEYQMRGVGDFDELYTVVEGVAPAERFSLVHFNANGRAAMQRANLTAEQDRMIWALVSQGGPSLLPGLDAENDGLIAARHLLAAAREERPDRVFAVLRSLDEPTRTAMSQTEAYAEALRHLERSDIEGRVLAGNIRRVVLRGELQEALEAYAIRPGTTPRIRDRSAFAELISHELDQGGGRSRQVEIRRGFVLHQRSLRHPDLELSTGDQALVDAYRDYANFIEGEDNEDQQPLWNVLLGAPRVVGGQQDLDPNMEADFMFYRLQQFAGLRGAAVAPWGWALHDLDEATVGFTALYERVRPGGVSPSDLAELVLRYHAAIRATEAYRDANESLASDVASIVACVVGVAVVTVLSGGTLGPVAIAAVAGLAGGSAAAITGAALRHESSGEDVATDFALGAVEGALAITGEALAARAVRGLGLAAEGAAEVATMSAGATARAAGTRAIRSTAARGAEVAVRGAIDGAVGGAGGELFRSALDEATWDRGVSEAIARIFQATLRGAAMGATFGGATGGVIFGAGEAFNRVASRHGTRAALDILGAFDGTELGVGYVRGLDEATQDALFRARAAHSIGRDDIARDLLTREARLTPTDADEILDALRARADLARRVTSDIDRTIDDDVAAALGDELGVPIRVDSDLAGHRHRVEVDYRLGVWGSPDALTIRVAPGTPVGDVIAHQAVVRRIRDFGRASRSFRGFFERAHAFLRGASDTMPLRAERLAELDKYGLMIEARQRALTGEALSDELAERLEREIAELRRWRAHFAEQLDEVGAGQGVIRSEGEMDFSEEAMRARWERDLAEPDLMDDALPTVTEAQDAAATSRYRYSSSTQLPVGTTADEVRDAFRTVHFDGRGAESFGQFEHELRSYVALGVISEADIMEVITRRLNGTQVSGRARVLGPIVRDVRRMARASALREIEEGSLDLLEVLDVLPPFGKGDVFESWFSRHGGPGIEQISVDARRLREQGPTLAGDRRIDRIEAINGDELDAATEDRIRRMLAGDTMAAQEGPIPSLRVRELKAGRFTGDHRAQLRDNLRLLRLGAVNEVSLTITRLDAIDPSQLAWLQRQLRRYRGQFVIEVVNGPRITSSAQLGRMR